MIRENVNNSKTPDTTIVMGTPYITFPLNPTEIGSLLRKRNTAYTKK